MTATELIDAARRHGSRLVAREGRIEVRGRRLPDELREAVREHVGDLVAALEAMEMAVLVEAAADAATVEPPEDWRPPEPAKAPGADLGQCFDCRAALGRTPDGETIEIGLCAPCQDRRMTRMAKSGRVDVRRIEAKDAEQLDLPEMPGAEGAGGGS